MVNVVFFRLAPIFVCDSYIATNHMIRGIYAVNGIPKSLWRPTEPVNFTFRCDSNIEEDKRGKANVT